MPKYFCDYCDTYLTHDSPSVRKTHCNGRKHKENVRDYYQKWLEDQVQKLVDDTTAAFKQGKIQNNPFAGANPKGGAAIPPPANLAGTAKKPPAPAGAPPPGAPGAPMPPGAAPPRPPGPGGPPGMPPRGPGPMAGPGGPMPLMGPGGPMPGPMMGMRPMGPMGRMPMMGGPMMGGPGGPRPLMPGPRMGGPPQS